MILGVLVYRMIYDEVAGIVSGVWQPGDPRLFEQSHADGPAGHRLCNDLREHDDRDDSLRRHRGRVLPMRTLEGRCEGMHRQTRQRR